MARLQPDSLRGPHDVLCGRGPCAEAEIMGELEWIDRDAVMARDRGERHQAGIDPRLHGLRWARRVCGHGGWRVSALCRVSAADPFVHPEIPGEFIRRKS